PAAHVLISGGVPKEEHFDYLQSVFRSVASAIRVPIDIMMVPAQGLLDIDELASIGINQLSINLELYNDDAARRIMPRKAKQGLKHYLAFIEAALARMGAGSVRSMLLVGIEPVEDTLKGVKALAERGCEPVLSPFRPDPSTPMRNLSPPDSQTMEDVY